MIKKLLSYFFFFLFAAVGMGQTILMTNTTVTTCSGTFYDSGGNSGSYQNSESYTLTICSGNSNVPKLSFTTFNTESTFDVLTIYDGNSTTCGASVIGTYSGTVSPFTVTGLSPCITIVFKSDASVNDPGWAATISCVAPGSPSVTVPNAQDCLGAISVCQSSYTNTVSYSGTGNISNEINTSLTGECLGSGEKNDVWYQFNVQTAGQLCFVIDPVTNSNDYDWALYNLTNASCSKIACDHSLEVGCNYSSSTTWAGSTYTWVTSGATTGNTGMVPTTPQSGYTQNQPCIAVTAGQFFVLNVSNFSASANGYSLYFPPPGTPGMAQIYDNVPPVLATVASTPVCGSTTLAVSFSENVKCSTVNANNFALSGPGGPYSITAVSSVCQSGAPDAKTFTLTISPPITSAGTFTICQNNPSGSVQDACGNNSITNTCITFSITGLPTVSLTPANPNCNPGTGTITASASGSGSPFTYDLNGGAYQTSPSFTNLAAGTYTIGVKDNNGCTSVASATITLPAAITVSLTPTDVTCAGNDGAITSTVTGGTPAYTYSWSPSGSGANPTGLTQGTYTATVKDSKGCIKTATATIAQNGSVTANFTPPVSQCLPGNNFTFNNTGTSTGVTFDWNFGDGSAHANTASATHSYTAAGTYTVTETVSDGGCSGVKTATLSVVNIPTIAVNSATICAGDSASLSANGATTYSWAPATGLSSVTNSAVKASPGSSTVYTITGSTGSCSNTATSTVTVNSVPAIVVNSGSVCPGGQIALTVSGASTYSWNPSTGLSSNSAASVTASPSSTQVYTVAGSVSGCTTSATSTVTVFLAPVIIVNNATICNGQSATLNATGGITYSWSPPATLSAASGASVQATPSSSTNYIINATDVNGCAGTATAMVTVNPLPTITVNNGNICSGQTSVNLTANGAMSYTWSPATGLNNTSGSTVNAGPSATTVYSITGADMNGCISSANSTVTVLNNPVLTVNSPSVCIGSTVTLNVSGASTYVWSPSVGLSTVTGNSVNASPSSTTVYTINGTSGSCTATAASTVTVFALPVVSVNSASICPGQQSATLTASGASSYAWLPAYAGSGPTIITSPTVNITCTVTGTDNNNCINTATAVVTLYTLPAITANSPSVCIGTSASLIASGGQTYTWSPASGLNQTSGNTVSASSLSSTQYNVMATDIHGCTGSAVSYLTVNQFPNITVSASKDSICLGQQTSTLTAGGGVSYSWSNTGSLNGGGKSVVANPSTNTLYTVTGTDANGCSNTASIAIAVIGKPQLVLNPKNVSGCNPLSPVTFSVSSNPAAQTYTWTMGNGVGYTGSGYAVVSTEYTVNGLHHILVNVADVHGCTDTTGGYANVFPLPAADFDWLNKPVSILAPEVQFVNESAGNITYYNWNFGDGTDSSKTKNPLHTYLNVGSYNASLFVKTDKGCRDSVTKTVIIEDDYALYVPNAFSPNADSHNDVFKASGEGIIAFNMYVYDRWGNLIFTSADLDTGWDGRKMNHGDDLMPEDVYIWKIELKTFKKQKDMRTGTVTLLK